MTPLGITTPLTGVENGGLKASWAVWTGRKVPSGPKCDLSRSGRPGHPEGRSGAEEALQRLDLVD